MISGIMHGNAAGAVGASSTMDGERISIRNDEVPCYLQKGSFFASLEGGSTDEIINVPSNVLKQDTSVQNTSDLRYLLNSLRFWMVLDIPSELIAYVLKTKGRSVAGIIQEFSSDLKHLNILHKLLYQRTNKQMKIAVEGGCLEVVEYLANTGLNYKKGCRVAARAGQLPCLQLLHNNHYHWDATTCMEAARAGSLECLQYAHENGCEWDGSVCEAAVLNGNFDCLRYACDNDCQPTPKTMILAAMFNRRDCMQYLHELGCAWTTQICTAAAKHGSLECLMYAHEHGCEWDWEASWYAKARGHHHCVQYLQSQGCPG